MNEVFTIIPRFVDLVRALKVDYRQESMTENCLLSQAVKRTFPGVDVYTRIDGSIIVRDADGSIEFRPDRPAATELLVAWFDRLVYRSTRPSEWKYYYYSVTEKLDQPITFKRIN